MKTLTLITLGLLLVACDQAPQETPYVQDSAKASPRWTVDIDRVLDGVARAYRPRCLDGVRIDHTVEFRNYQPEIPADVTAVSQPEGAQSLYSPNLLRPYNYQQPDDPAEQAYSYWRYTFQVPGVYDWVNSQGTEPGRKVVDPYYGTVTFVGLDPNSPFGTICVEEQDGSGCDGVCCSDDDDCPSSQRCFVSEVDAVGRCLTPSG